MKIVLIGVSHWHTPFYLDPALELPDMQVVGVADPDLARAEVVAAQALLSMHITRAQGPYEHATMLHTECERHEKRPAITGPADRDKSVFCIGMLRIGREARLIGQ